MADIKSDVIRNIDLPSKISSGWVNVGEVRELHSASGEELSPTLRFGDAAQSALMPSMPALSTVEGLDKALKAEL